MEIILKNMDNAITTNISINNTNKISEFLDEIYSKLDELEKNSYYCIWFEHKNKYKKKIKAKLGYIYYDKNNCEQKIQIADENYIKYYIEKMGLNTLNIEYTKGTGLAKKVKIRSIRNARGMWDDVCCDIQEFLSPEIKMRDILKLKDFYSLSFKLVNITYTNLKNEKCIEDARNFIEDKKKFSEFIEINCVDTEKEILLTWVI